MNSDVMESVYGKLREAVSKIGTFGIERAEAVEVEKGLVVILRAGQTLWTRIEHADKYTYPTGMVDALGTLGAAIWSEIENGTVNIMPAEPLMVGLAQRKRNGGLELTDVEQEGDSYKVPSTRIGTLLGLGAKITEDARYTPWARWLLETKIYNPEDPNAKFVDFFFLPPRLANLTDCALATQIARGWNYHRTLGREHFAEMATLLHGLSRTANPLG